MRSVNDAIQDCISQNWIPDNLVPSANGNRAGDQQRPFPFTVVDDLQQVPSLLGVQRLGTPVVDDEQAGPLEASHQARQPPFAARGGEVGEQARCSTGEGGEPITAGFMAQRAGQPRFADPRWTSDQDVVAVADPATGGERLEQAAVETARRAQIGVLDYRVRRNRARFSRRPSRLLSRAVTSRSISSPSQSSRDRSSAADWFACRGTRRPLRPGQGRAGGPP